MKWLLIPAVISLLSVSSGYAQNSNDYTQGDITVIIEEKGMVDTSQGVCESSSELSMTFSGKVLYNKTICTADPDDVMLVEKGYMTVIEHYSSPVGWSQFYIFDLCKKRLVITKQLQESPALNWDEFIDISPSTKDKYVKEVKNL